MPRPRAWIAVPAIVVGVIAPDASGLAQEPPGRTVGVIPDASALRSEGSRALAVQQPVYMGDRIQTGPKGEAQIHFLDATRLVVGPASSLLIDSSVMRNSKTLQNFAVRALRGAFRFISGSSPKPAYSIVTPTATIGVRGTQFDFAVLPNGGTEFVLLHGGADVCDRYRNCIRVSQACDMVSIPPTGPIRRVGEREERNARLRTYFPYVRNQYATLRQDFRANVASCGNIAALPSIQGAPPDLRELRQPAASPPQPTPARQERPTARPSPQDSAPQSSTPSVVEPSPPSVGRPSEGTGSKPDSSPSRPDCCGGKPDHSGPNRRGGNPGNDKSVGKAGESPNGRDFGGGSRGRSDSHDRGGPGSRDVSPSDPGPDMDRGHDSRGRGAASDSHSPGSNSPGIGSDRGSRDRDHGPGRSSERGGGRGEGRNNESGGNRGRGDDNR